MKTTDHDSKVSDKNKEGDITVKDQKGATLAEILEADDIESRFWLLSPVPNYSIDDEGVTVDLPRVYGDSTIGIVDEEAGGIVAYVGTEKLANLLLRLLEVEHDE